MLEIKPNGVASDSGPTQLTTKTCSVNRENDRSRALVMFGKWGATEGSTGLRTLLIEFMVGMAVRDGGFSYGI